MLRDAELRKFAEVAGRSDWTKEQQAFVEHGRFVKPKMGNRSHNMILWDRSIEDARNFDRIQLNNKSFRNFLAVDVDGAGATDEEMRGNALERLLGHPVVPHVIVPTPHGAHGIWAIDSTPWGERIDVFAQDCQRNLCRAVEGDQSYGAYTVANPLCLQLDPLWLRDIRAPYKLADIKGPLASSWQTPAPWEHGDGGAGDGRNADVFTRAKELALQGVPLGEAEAQLQEYNSTLPEPLPEEEVSRAVRSGFKPRRGSSPYLQRLSRKGGSRNTEAQYAARSSNLQKANAVRHEHAGQRFDFVLERWKSSNAELASELGVHPRTIRRYRQDAKRSGLVPV